ncbi:MAG: glycosyltransferase [Acidobacteria bacterium]|nr:glycosyltransferase [Acidobacteriota bacterium]
MKICHFCSSHVNTIYFAYLACGLSERGAKQFFVSQDSFEPPYWLKDCQSVDYTNLGVSGRLRFPWAVQRLARFLKEKKIDILHTHLFDAALIGLAAAQIAGTRVRVVSRHHLDETAILGTRVHSFLDKWTNEVADCVVVPSEATRRYMTEVEKQSGENIRVIPYGFDFNALNATEEDRERVRAEFGVGKSFVIGCVGRFFKNKGHRYLFEAIQKLKTEFPGVKVLLLGSGDRQYLEKDIAELDLGQNVIFAGFRNDIPACMKAMDLLVHPSLSESFGQVIVEAMCVGTPVVATSVGGVPEIVENEKTGIVVRPRDSNELYTAIKRLIKDADLRSKFGEAGRESVLDKFNVQLFVERQWACYRELFDQ